MSKDEKYIKLCLELAKKSQGLTSPNPLVGAVLVVENKIIGKGYHTGFGKPHAEIEAIKDAIRKGYSHLLKQATLYVNLEPCCHFGKTPPCTDKILEVGIKRVVCSMYDPNPKVKGKGIKILKNKGVKCKIGVLEKEAKELNKFYIKWITKGLPYVTIKSAVTLDGKIATYSGNSKWISCEASRRYIYKLRGIYDAVLVGINTILKDNPRLTTHGLYRDPVRVVIGDISRFKNIYSKYNVFIDTKKTIFFTPKSSLAKFLTEKFANIEIFEFNQKKFFFKKVLSLLAKMGITSVLVEGGGETSWNLIKEKLVDDVLIFISPKIFGGRTAKTWVEGEGVRFPSKAYKVEFLSIEKIAEDFVIKAKLLY